MKSITIHNLDDDLYKIIRTEAKRNMRSMNQEIKDKLINVFIRNKQEKQVDSFKNFLGLWSEEEYLQFREKTEDFDRVYESDWTS